MVVRSPIAAGNVDLGGITQPIIGQRKIEHELRMKEGEVAIIGGLVTRQDDKTVTGIPGLSSIPLLGTGIIITPEALRSRIQVLTGKSKPWSSSSSSRPMLAG